MLKRLLIVWVSFISSTANAGELNRTELNKLVQGLTPTPIKYNGQDGVWFSTLDANRVLEILEKRLPLALDIIDSQDKEITSLKNAINTYRLSLESYQEYAEYNTKMFDMVMKHIPDLKPLELAWYEKPSTTFVYGVITGVIVIITSAYVLEKSLKK